MIRTVEAIIDERGAVLLQEAVALSAPRRALVTILEEEPNNHEAALLSEAALAEDWTVPRRILHGPISSRCSSSCFVSVF